jgi:hypothetical protein
MRTGMLLTVILSLSSTSVLAQTCIERCSSACMGNEMCENIADACLARCRNEAPPPAPNWVVLAFSQAEYTAGIGQGFPSKDAAVLEAMTVCRRNRGADCKVAWAGTDVCLALVESSNTKPWVWTVAGGSSREEAGESALRECRKRGGDNCLIRNTPCSSDNNLFPAPFEPANRLAIVDPRTVGTWELPVGKGRWVWQIDAGGAYEFHSETGDGARHWGSFASNGKVWALHQSTGPNDGGPYTLQGPDTLRMTGTLGTGNWHRVVTAH